MFWQQCYEFHRLRGGKKESGVGAVSSVMFYLLLRVTVIHFFGQADVSAWLFEQWQLLGPAGSEMHSREISWYSAFVKMTADVNSL